MKGSLTPVLAFALLLVLWVFMVLGVIALDRRLREEGRDVAPGRVGQAVGEASHNALVGHLSAALLRLMHDNIRLNLGELKSVPAANRLLMSQHEAIYKGIRENKPQAARSAAETHIDFVRETLAQTLRSVARRETAERRSNTDFTTS